MNSASLLWTKDWQANPSFNQIQNNTADPFNNIGTFENGGIWLDAGGNDNLFFAKKIVKSMTKDDRPINGITRKNFMALDPLGSYSNVGFRTVDRPSDEEIHTIFKGEI